MNRYHETHPDPEIRQKYNEWRTAYSEYVSRSHGFASAAAQKEHEEKKNKQEAVRTLQQQLQRIGQSVAFNLKHPTVTNDTKKRRRTAGRRGS